MRAFEPSAAAGGVAKHYPTVGEGWRRLSSTPSARLCLLASDPGRLWDNLK